MSFSFSPSPAPRRSTRTRQPPLSPPRRARVASSRLTTPIPGNDYSQWATDGSVTSIGSGMDIDEATSSFSAMGNRLTGDTVFAKSDQLSVSFYANLPLEVTPVLQNADFYAEAYTGGIDTVTGFALVASVQTCFVWQHAQALKGLPTCYIFACPQDQTRTSPPFHGLVPYGPTREPGLVLVSTSGEMRFWDSIGIGLAGGDHFSTTNLGLDSGDLVTNFIRADPQTYLASTSSGLLFRITLTSTGGKYHLVSHPFSRPTANLSFSRLLPSIFSSPSHGTSQIKSEPGNVSSITIGNKTFDGGRDVWALVDTRVQKWDMRLDGWEELVLDEDIIGSVRSAVRASLGAGAEQDNAKLDLELVDLAASEGSENMVLLVSYAAPEDENMMAMDFSGVRRIYALVHLSYRSDAFRIAGVRSVPYQSNSASGAPMHPRIQVMAEGQLVSIQFGDAVALCARDSDYCDRLALRSNEDRTLGVGVIQSDTTIIVMTAATMMKATVDMESVLAFDSEHGKANLIKSTMTQAILYGSSPMNPLQFSFPPEVDEESLMRGADQLSEAILESDPEVVQRNHDLSAQMTSRKERLSWLIGFINDNSALGKMSQSSRQKLATDAEKLYASHQLWVRHNELLATGPSHSVLNDIVYAYMCEVQEGHHEDFMRAFFRLRVEDIGKVILKVPEVTIHAAAETGRSVIDLLPEANSIILTVLKSAFDYREYNVRVYGIDLPMIKPWTSGPAVVDVIQTLFETTASVVDAPTSGADNNLKKGEPYSQLPELATALFECIQQWLSWLETASATGTEDGAARDRHELEQRFASLRPAVLETLRRSGHEAAAFTLAEKYHDFSSLADLCHRDIVYPPEKNPNALRIQAYVDRFKDEFTTELYRWYIQHGELRVMFAQDESHNAYLDKFFATNPTPAISWIHDLGNGNHEAAATALLKEANHASYSDPRQLMLSIGKLSHLAQLQLEGSATADGSILDAFHDGLDFVSVHEALLQEFQEVLQNLRGRQSLDNQVDAIAKSRAAMLSDRKALTGIFKNLIRELLQGKVLSIEDTVDVLTLKDNIDTVEDFATALHLLASVQKEIPEVRKLSAFRTVWRRIYIHDDWATISHTVGISDAELGARFRSTALYTTLRATLPREDQPEGYDTIPDAALLTPTAADITSRWPGIPPDQVEGLLRDHDFERDRLGELELNDMYSRVRELAVQEIMWNGDL